MRKVKELLVKGNVEAAAKLINYTSPELDEYIRTEDLEKNHDQYMRFLAIGDRITMAILKLIDNDVTRTSK
jgi:hypothetical protein